MARLRLGFFFSSKPSDSLKTEKERRMEKGRTRETKVAACACFGNPWNLLSEVGSGYRRAASFRVGVRIPLRPLKSECHPAEKTAPANCSLDTSLDTLSISYMPDNHLLGRISPRVEPPPPPTFPSFFSFPLSLSFFFFLPPHPPFRSFLLFDCSFFVAVKVPLDIILAFLRCIEDIFVGRN